ncbi:MAG: ROK family protein [Sandaracinaceae bacterium]|nr:ROK family protein [Sandaracinaceae bacterium]
MRIGVDLGGTKIEAVALADDGAITARERVPTPAADGYEAIVDAVAALVRRLDPSGRGPVGVGSPGALSPTTGLLRNSNTVCLNGRPLAVDLSDALGREVRLANDADCFALSEAVDGAAAGAETVFGVIVGTGTGGGFVVRGQLVRGPNAIAGEWGHVPLPWPHATELPGPACYCGRRGCLETWLSGPGIAADHERATGARLDAGTLAERARDGDAAASATLDRHVDRFARGLASVINVFDPHVIVLGGGVSNLAHLYTAIPERWGAYVFSDAVATRLVKNLHGDSSGVRGAAWLVGA